MNRSPAANIPEGCVFLPRKLCFPFTIAGVAHDSETSFSGNRRIIPKSFFTGENAFYCISSSLNRCSASVSLCWRPLITAILSEKRSYSSSSSDVRLTSMGWYSYGVKYRPIAFWSEYSLEGKDRGCLCRWPFPLQRQL